MQVQKPKQGYKLVKSLFGKYEEIPEEWDMKVLGNLGEPIIGLTYEPNNVQPEGILVLRAPNIHDGQLRFEDNVYVNLDVPEKLKIRKGDLLICVRNGSKNLIGKCAYIDENFENMTFGAFMSVFRSPFNRFIYHQFQTEIIRKQISKSTTATINQITNKNLNSFQIPMPTLTEQQKITSILSNVDFLIQQTEKEFAQTQKLKIGLMQRLLTKGIGHTKFKKVKSLFDKYEEIPQEWNIKKIEEIVIKLVSGGTPSTSNPEFWNGDIPWTKSAALTQHYINSGERFITKKGLENSSSVVIPKNNLLIASRVSMENLSINKIDIAINQDITAIIADKSKISVEFLYWYLLKYIQKLTSFSQGSTIQGFTRKELSEFLIKLPSLEEQQKITSILSNVDLHIKLHQEYKSNLENLKKGLMQKLLTGQIRVKV